MDVNRVKEEVMEAPQESRQNFQTLRASEAPVDTDNVISLSSSSSRGYSEDDSDMESESPIKKQKIKDVLPVGFLDPLSPEQRLAMQQQRSAAAARNNYNTNFGFPVLNRTHANVPSPFPPNVGEKLVSTVKKEPDSSPVVEVGVAAPVIKSCKQFWKAGDYERGNGCDSSKQAAVGMDHVRVHPRFLHSNATSHKWALGAFAELLDNALDEVSNGATYVHIDMQKNKKDNSAILVVEDDGGGMTPDKIRQCMSLGYSEKSKLANTIGQYGNGFKTSTMRLGADVIVFSRSKRMDRSSATQSIGMLSYTFLRRTGKEDIVVPMIDFEKRGKSWTMLMRSTSDDWKRNLETIVQWSPYESEHDLLQQFDYLKDQGTHIIIYNLWEDDQGRQELDFNSDQHDIQIRGVNRDEKKIEMAKKYSNSRHFLTYRHSLRSYASILYLRIPSGFRIILRGTDVEHHNIVNDMMYSKEFTYRPQGIPDETPKDPNMHVIVTLGFVKDANYHIDVQGFNVYHKNRLIKPFWRVWNAAGSDGRGVIGVLEANFVEPAHDKQSFERTIVFSRLETRLVALQKTYWTTNCQLVGYAQRHHPKNSVSPENKASPASKDRLDSRAYSNELGIRYKGKYDHRLPAKYARQDEIERVQDQTQERNDCKTVSTSGETQLGYLSNRKTDQFTRHSCLQTTNSSRDDHELVHSDTDMVVKLKEENLNLKENLEAVRRDLQDERGKNKLLENKLQERNVLLEERIRLDSEVETLRNKLKDATDTMEMLVDKVKLLERSRANFNCKREQ